MAIADRHGLPVACCITSASAHESKLVDATVAQHARLHGKLFAQESESAIRLIFLDKSQDGIE